jgi:hypothetical protein
MAEIVPFGSASYFIFLSLVLAARGMDFLSTWIATPRLELEANPLARAMGWKRGIALNICVAVGIALWPLPAIMVTTTSLLVAARNFQHAWLMRGMGEVAYLAWMSRQISRTSRGLYFGCLIAQAGLVASIGVALAWFGRHLLVPLAIGWGIVAYAVAVLAYTWIGARKAFDRRAQSDEF